MARVSAARDDDADDEFRAARSQDGLASKQGGVDSDSGRLGRRYGSRGDILWLVILARSGQAIGY